MKLTSMINFVLDQEKLEFTPIGKDYADEWSDFCLIKLDKIVKNANLLKQPLNIGMFAPCDDYGNVLKKPIETIGSIEMYAKKYETAKSKVIFKDFEITNQDDECVSLKNIASDLTLHFHIEEENNITNLIEVEYQDKDYNGYYETIEDLVIYDLELTISF